MSTHDERAEVLHRIEQWKLRPPRLKDDVITMAHGAGGKASQSLTEASTCVRCRQEAHEAPASRTATIAA